MVDQIQPSLGNMELTQDCSTMQTALQTAEIMTAKTLITEAYLLEYEYNLQTKAADKIPDAHDQNYMLTIHIAAGMTQDGKGGYTVQTKTLEFNDPGYPPPSVTGATAEQYEDETEATMDAVNTGLETWQQATEQALTSGYSELNQMSQNETGFVQFSSDANNASEFLTQLVRTKLT
ncbi:MAG: hypothetical protein KDK64_01950 [Chlamydiia bacterium]|nr:hypothetical protein [Chlamydiia bacterium]